MTQDVKVETNADRRATRLRREILKQHRWRVSTWAKAEQYIKVRQDELEELGFDREELFEADFSNEALLDTYTQLSQQD